MLTMKVSGDQVRTVSSQLGINYNAPIVDSGSSAPPSIPTIYARTSSGGTLTLNGPQVFIPVYAPGTDFKLTCAEGDTQILVVGGPQDGYIGFFHF